MNLHIAGVLDADTRAAISGHLADEADFVDGTDTAGGLARAVKYNQQLADTPAARAITRLVEQRLRAHPVFMAAARPRDFVRLQVSRYLPGMAYGEHVDAALIDRRRTDLSFTCFLSAPDDYDGGELVVRHAGGEQAVKLPAGDCFLYPAGSVHRVSEVTSGQRLAVVGWVRSLIRDSERRELLFGLENTMERVADGAEPAEVALELARLRNALLRRWVED